MSELWPHATKQNRCAVCGKPDWCSMGGKGWRCQRVESPRPFKTGGWFHPFDDSKPRAQYVPRNRPFAPLINGEKLMKEYLDAASGNERQIYADLLGVSRMAVEALECGYSREHRAWAFPMFDGTRKIIGIRLRNNEGGKWAVRGSRNGIFLPLLDPQSPAYLCEGPTSTAAALTLGFYAIGRPACHLGGREIKIALRRLGIRRAVVVADNDAKPNGLTPGLSGALALAGEIGVRCVVWTPPTKDIRDFLKSGGTRSAIEDQLKEAVWKFYKKT